MTALASDRAGAALGAIWARRRGEILASVGVVEDAVLDALSGQLDDGGRERACREAHKLAGSAGTFGFMADDGARPVAIGAQDHDLLVEAIAHRAHAHVGV